MDVPCDFGTLIINIGDMLQEASRGYYPSTTHRVINPTGAVPPSPASPCRSSCTPVRMWCSRSVTPPTAI